MLTKKIAMAAIAGTALLAASGAYARDDHWGYGPRHHHHRHGPRFVVRPAPVYYYAPAPVYYPYYPPQPVYYAPPPRPVIFGSIPIGDSRVRIGLRF